MNIVVLETSVVLFGLFTVGAVFGSLLNVCIYRLPREERFWRALRFLVYPPSHCPRCQERIKPYDNLPVVGWLILGGRCRNCRGSISVRYPLIEFMTATLFAALYWFEVPQFLWTVASDSSVYHILGPTGLVGPRGISGAGGAAGEVWLSPIALLQCRYAVHLVLIVALIAATFIDIDLRIIPDTVTLPAMAVGILANTILGNVYLVPLWYQTPAMSTAARMYGALIQPFFAVGEIPSWLVNWMNFVGVPAWMTAHPHWHGLCLSLAGIIVGGGSVWAVRIVGHWALKREAMGFGDVILMAMIGSFIGWQATLIVFVLALLSAIVVVLPLWIVWRNHELPFGPYLSVGTLLLLMFARPIWPSFDTQFFAMGPLLVPLALIMAGTLAAMLFGWRSLRKRLGWEPAEPEFEEAWHAGDQLAYLAGEGTNDRQGQWPRCEWPGLVSGRGQTYEHLWRQGGGGHPVVPWQRNQRS